MERLALRNELHIIDLENVNDKEMMEFATKLDAFAHVRAVFFRLQT